MKHSNSIIETENIGAGTKVWAFSHLCEGAVIGKGCVIGEGVYVGPGVTIGDRCKIQNHVLLYKGVHVEDEVFIGPNVVTTNDIFPKAVGDWEDRFRQTFIRRGASLGANSTIVCGVTIGEGAMVGAGSVVTHDVMPYSLVRGNPARHVRFLR